MSVTIYLHNYNNGIYFVKLKSYVLENHLLQKKNLVVKFYFKDYFCFIAISLHVMGIQKKTIHVMH